jgi:twinkle protein
VGSFINLFRNCGTDLSEFVSHGPCDDCGSSDGVGWYNDGHGVCFVCEKYYPPVRATRGKELSEKKSNPNVTPLADVFRAIPKRGLPEEAIKKYLIDINMDKEVDVAHRYPYFKEGVHVGNKVRKRSEKLFWWEGESSGELFGQQLFPAGSAKAITIVEGELDAPSAWLLLGSRYPVVSVRNSGSAVKDCKDNYEYLDSFEDVVICFDKDEVKYRNDGTPFYPGQDAAKKVAELFKPGKARILQLEHGKDPNDYRQQGIEAKVFISEWWKAPKFSPDGLIVGTEMWDKIVNRPSHFQTPYPFAGVNKLTYGVRLSEFVVINAPTGVGKTSFLKELEYAILTNPEVLENGYGIGFLHLEEMDSDLALGLMSIHRNKRFNLPDVEKSEAELRSAYD